LLVVAVLLLAAQGGLQAFNAGKTGTRTSSASVVATGSAYDGITTFTIKSLLTGYVAQEGVRVANQGKVTTTFTWSTTSDPSGVVTTFTDCAANTAVGSTCSVLFTGPPKAAGTYTFTGKITGTATGFRTTIPSITVTVQYCLVPC
jgi:hypothetical protein